MAYRRWPLFKYLFACRQPYWVYYVFVVLIFLISTGSLFFAIKCADTDHSSNYELRNENDNEETKYSKTLLSPDYSFVSIHNDVDWKSKILCLITTTVRDLNNKTRAVNNTWGRRCDKTIYVLSLKSATHINSPDILKVNVQKGRASTTRQIFMHVYNQYKDEYDWFMKGDDDSYVVIENLRHLLSHYSPKEAVSIGHNVKYVLGSNYGYHSGGGTYVISRQALLQLNELGYSQREKCEEDGGDENVEIHKCLARTGTVHMTTVDALGRDSFHPEPWSYHVLKTGPGCCSPLWISFHRVKPEEMYIYDHLLYRTSVYGLMRDQPMLDGLFSQKREDKIKT